MTERHKPDDPLAGPLARTLAAGLNRSGRECPNAEVLALYFDRALAADEAARWERHFSACARCQQQLAAMARMELAEAPAAQPRPGGISWLWSWRWMGPAAAALGALAIWVVVQNTTPRSSPAEPMIAQQVKREPDSETLQRPTPEKAEGVDAVRGALGKEQIANSQPGRAASGVASEAGAKRSQEPQIATVTRAPSDRADTTPVAKPLEPGRAGQQPAAVAVPDKKDAVANEFAVRAESQKTKEEATRESEARNAEVAAVMEKQAAVQAAPQKPAAQAPAATMRANEADLRAARDELKTKEPQAPVQATETVTVESGAVDSKLRQKSQIPARYSAAAPAGSAVVWRLGPSGSIERSTDSGATWQRQASGVTADLLAGSAPTAKICWAAGRGGVVLRTTDGSTWTQIGSPTSQDLVAVVAVDADRATVTTAEGKSYATSDAGRTWKSQ